MKNILNLVTIAVVSLMLLNGCSDNKLRALIVTGPDGSGNTAKSALQKILENSGKFNVEIAESPAEGQDMSIYSPDFTSFDVVVLDYIGEKWPSETRERFVKYVKDGGGVLVFGESAYAFPDWDEYGRLIGIGGNRDNSAAPYMYLNGNGEIMTYESINDTVNATTAVHDFVIQVTGSGGPVFEGMNHRWLHLADVLHSDLKLLSDSVTVLAMAYANRKSGGNGKNMPVMAENVFGKGRVFSVFIGCLKEGASPAALQDAGLILAVQRGAEWAATGQVTQQLPEDLPNIAAAFVLPNYKFYSLNDLFVNAKNYEYGKPEKFLYLISNRIRKAKGNKQKLAVFEDKILEVMQSDDATIECKNYLCRDLSSIGTEKSIPVLEKLKENEKTADMARFALERIKSSLNK
ncbi:MAG: ThuA domain-containing protein [Chlorobi bacterium]|nr:ThuA domain-containing protein [Chlorobiota bacterium]